ncbi:MAG TPA: hypothetical protein VF170_04570 [Planctomycetaceae bacterium]
MTAATTAEPIPSRLGRLSGVRACWMKSGPVVQGRAVLRMPFDEPVVVTPWELAAGRPAGPSLLASGRDLSPTGLSFSHADPLPCRFAAVSFRGERTDPEGGPLIETVVVRLLWCRFLRGGTYLSGGRFERMLGDEFGRPLATLLGQA